MIADFPISLYRMGASSAGTRHRGAACTHAARRRPSGVWLLLVVAACALPAATPQAPREHTGSDQFGAGVLLPPAAAAAAAPGAAEAAEAGSGPVLLAGAAAVAALASAPARLAAAAGAAGWAPPKVQRELAADASLRLDPSSNRLMYVCRLGPSTSAVSAEDSPTSGAIAQQFGATAGVWGSPEVLAAASARTLPDQPLEKALQLHRFVGAWLSVHGNHPQRVQARLPCARGMQPRQPCTTLLCYDCMYELLFAAGRPLGQQYQVPPLFCSGTWCSPTPPTPPHRLPSLPRLMLVLQPLRGEPLCLPGLRWPHDRGHIVADWFSHSHAQL